MVAQYGGHDSRYRQHIDQASAELRVLVESGDSATVRSEFAELSAALDRIS